MLETNLNALFPHRVKIAPIKDLQRYQAKLAEARDKDKEGYQLPYAATVCDYLRATVLCKSMAEMMATLHKLGDSFNIVRVKPRIRKNPGDTGNKCILVNLVVEDATLKPLEYAWSDWWINKRVRMIAEVRRKKKILGNC